MNETVRLILTIIHVINCVFIVLAILFQSSKSEGLSGALTGTAETFFGKSNTRSIDAKLAKLTGICAAVFIGMSFILSIF